MDHGLFIVRHEGQHHGPFRDDEAAIFASKLEGPSDVIPLLVPRLASEERGPIELRLLESAAYRAYIDSVKVDTQQMLADMTQECFFTRREGRVFTVREICDLWESLHQISQAVESLMYYADQVVAAPSPENLEALRKAVWRNRNSDDVDPDFRDGFWSQRYRGEPDQSPLIDFPLI